jgi:hypothetical protein
VCARTHTRTRTHSVFDRDLRGLESAQNLRLRCIAGIYLSSYLIFDCGASPAFTCRHTLSSTAVHRRHLPVVIPFTSFSPGVTTPASRAAERVTSPCHVPRVTSPWIQLRCWACSTEPEPSRLGSEKSCLTRIYNTIYIYNSIFLDCSDNEGYSFAAGRARLSLPGRI